MHRSRSLLTITALAGAVVSAASVAVTQALAYSASPEANTTPAVTSSVFYGKEVVLGNGRARTYIIADEKGKPSEIGVSLDEKALEGLPAAGSGHNGGHVMPHTSLLSFPEGNGTPFKFLELNWNPAGHEPDGVYQDVPHFDFHFYTITKEQREAMVPTNPAFVSSANKLPGDEYVPAFSKPLGPPGAEPSKLAVPMMGVHWSDLRSAELQKLLGKPEAFKPFTATFIYGSWNGEFHFWEPMITRAHLLEKKNTIDAAVRDQVIPISVPAKYSKPGYYPAAYRITWDADSREYRIALTELVYRK